MIEIREINDIESLANDRMLWSVLFAQTRQASFFQTLDWLVVYWRYFGAGQQLRVLVVYVDGRAIGILPLVVKKRRQGPTTTRVLTYPLDDWGTFYGPIGPNPTATLRLGLAHIGHTHRDWDYLELRWTGTETTDQGRTPVALVSAGMTAKPGNEDEVALIELDGTWADYVTARGHKWRVNHRRSERKLAELGSVRYVRHRPAPAANGDGDPRWDLYDACEHVAGQSWQGAATDGTTLSHAEVREYLRETHAVAARLGMVDMNVLYINDRPVAFVYNYCHQGRLFGLRRGFDAHAANGGAGSALLARTIEDSFARGDHEFNLGAGYLESKRHWLTRLVPSASFCHYPATSLKGHAVRLARAWKGRRNPLASNCSPSRTAVAH